LQDLFDEWTIYWQHRGHDALRDPAAPRRKLSPNEKYAALVAAAGYLPITLSGTDYLELLPVKWRQINDYGVRIDNRIYDSPELGRYRRQPSGLSGKRGLWEVHYDPYDLSRVFVRNHHDGGWITAPWTHLPMVAAPFADFTWRHARRLVAESGREVTETEIARALDDLLTRAEHGPDTTGRKIAARTRAAAVTRRSAPEPAEEAEQAAPQHEAKSESTEVVPFGVFDADAEAERWI
jgi:putative transposase